MCTFFTFTKGVKVEKFSISLHTYQLISNVNSLPPLIVVVSINWSTMNHEVISDFLSLITSRFLQLMAWWWCCSDVAYVSLCCRPSGSCVGRCGEEFTRGQRCTCDFSCHKHNECCPDFQSTCITGMTPSGPSQCSLLDCHSINSLRSGICFIMTGS